MMHIIRRQIIQLEVDKRQNAFRMQQLMSDYYWNHIIPVLERIFEEKSRDGLTIYFDKLEIDLGIFVEKDLIHQGWKDQLYSNICKQIDDQLNINSLGAISYSSSEKLNKRESHNSSVCRQWIFYIVHGFLPWNILTINEVWKEKVLEALQEEYAIIVELRQIFLANPVAVKRIIEQHDEKFLVKILEVLTKDNYKELLLLMRELEILLNDGTSIIRKKIWKQLLMSAATPDHIKNIPESAQAILKHFNIHPSFISSQPLEKFPILFNNLKEIKKVKNNSENAPLNYTIKNKIPENEFQQCPQSVVIDEEGVFVQHAGLVLLHPFLSLFLERLSLVDGNQFVNEAARLRALYLFHYLVTGNNSAEEHELLIPKILCSYPLDEAVDTDIQLTNDQKEEAIHLLDVIIGQWEILKNTSVEGLQEGFLKRSGKLVNRKDKIYLQVEASPVDVVLDHLPWNISMIKLPWMKDFLRVEWR